MVAEVQQVENRIFCGFGFLLRDCTSLWHAAVEASHLEKKKNGIYFLELVVCQGAPNHK